MVIFLYSCGDDSMGKSKVIQKCRRSKLIWEIF